MSVFNPSHQLSNNGPLSPALRQRIQRLRETKSSLTLAVLGLEMGLAGATLSTLLRDPAPANIRTKHVGRIVSAVEKLETEEGLSSQTSNGMEPPEQLEGSLASLIRLANSEGFAVTFTPLPPE